MFSSGGSSSHSGHERPCSTSHHASAYARRYDCSDDSEEDDYEPLNGRSSYRDEYGAGPSSGRRRCRRGYEYDD